MRFYNNDGSLGYRPDDHYFENKDDLVAVHKEAAAFSLDNQVQDRSPIPFHPGALKYFKERGVKG